MACSPASQVTVAPVAFAPLRVVPTPAAAASDENLSVDTLGDLFDRAHPLPAPEAAPQTVTKLLSEFVAEFQHIAREWNDACGAPAGTDRPARVLSAAS